MTIRVSFLFSLPSSRSPRAAVRFCSSVWRIARLSRFASGAICAALRLYMASCTAVGLTGASHTAVAAALTAPAPAPAGSAPESSRGTRCSLPPRWRRSELRERACTRASAWSAASPSRSASPSASVRVPRSSSKRSRPGLLSALSRCQVGMRSFAANCRLGSCSSCSVS
ncbi:hypothetical protein D3C73_979750 [compost metagenome]